MISKMKKKQLLMWEFQMDTDGPVIYPYTELIPHDMVLIYAYDDDINTKSNSNSYYKPKDNDDNALLSKELPGGTSI